MSEVSKKQRKVLIENVIKGLKERNMEGYYADNKSEALEICKKLLSGVKSVGAGGSMTMEEIGLTSELKSGNYGFIDRSIAKTSEEGHDLTLKMYDADAFVGSVNAITADGVLINIDGNSNRVSAYAFGPKKLILIVGVQKIASDLDSAMKRARNVASTMNCERLNRNTPCRKTGLCMNCKSPDTICCNFLITRYSRHSGRINVILVNEELGY